MSDTRLEVRKISPWSALKITAAVSVVGFLAWMAAVGIIYLALAGIGFWEPVAELIGGEGAISAGLVFAIAAGVGLLWMLLLIGLGALGAVAYNSCTELVGGIKIMLANDDS